MYHGKMNKPTLSILSTSHNMYLPLYGWKINMVENIGICNLLISLETLDADGPCLDDTLHKRICKKDTKFANDVVYFPKWLILNCF